MKYICLFIILTTTFMIYSSSDTYIKNPIYNEKTVQLILQNYKNYSLQSFMQMVEQASKVVTEETNHNNQEALQRKIAQENEKTILTSLSKINLSGK